MCQHLPAVVLNHAAQQAAMLQQAIAAHLATISIPAETIQAQQEALKTATIEFISQLQTRDIDAATWPDEIARMQQPMIQKHQSENTMWKQQKALSLYKPPPPTKEFNPNTTIRKQAIEAMLEAFSVVSTTQIFNSQDLLVLGDISMALFELNEGQALFTPKTGDSAGSPIEIKKFVVDNLDKMFDYAETMKVAGGYREPSGGGAPAQSASSGPDGAVTEWEVPEAADSAGMDLEYLNIAKTFEAMPGLLFPGYQKKLGTATAIDQSIRMYKARNGELTLQFSSNEQLGYSI